MSVLNAILVVAALIGADGPPGPTGALLGWTSNDPIIVQARELLTAGQFTAADALLKDAPATDDPATTRARREMAEVLRRIRLEYSLDQDALLTKLKPALPDITAEELTTWRDAGQVRYRTIDGQIRYFRREPGNLFRFCPAAKRRLEARAPKLLPTADDAEVADKLRAHLAAVIAAAKQTGQAEVLPVKHRVAYTLTVRPNRPGAKAGSLLRCWLPFPQEYRQQRDVKLLKTSPADHVVAPNGAEATGAPQRTVYLESRIDDPTRPVTFTEEFEYTSYAYYPQLRESDARDLPAGFDRTYLDERPPHIVFTPEIRATARKIVGDEPNPLIRLRKIFRFVDGHVRWGPEEEYAIIPSFCLQALHRGQGDCGLQGTLLITLCRAAGLPARWQSGWETKPWSWNMHDWAEVYIEPWGWLPVDPSYGLQGGDDPAIDEFYIGHQDSYRLIVNLDYGQPLIPPKTDLRSEPADFQRGEVELDGRNLYFDEWTYDMEFKWEPRP